MPSAVAVRQWPHEVKLPPVDYSGRLHVKPVELTLKIPADASSGPFSSSVTVSAANLRGRTIHIPVHARITNGLVVAPERLFLGVGQVRPPGPAVITLRSLDGRPVQVDGVLTSLPIEWTLLPARRADTPLKILLSCVQGQTVDRSRCGTVAVRAKDGRMATVSVVIAPPADAATAGGALPVSTGGESSM